MLKMKNGPVFWLTVYIEDVDYTGWKITILDDFGEIQHCYKARDSSYNHDFEIYYYAPAP